jgi:cob(I)alamin adenosyltransferase
MAFKIYTKTGDAGKTALFGGARIPKHHLRIEAYGTVDELNAHIGYLSDLSDKNNCSIPYLEHVQNELFNLGSVLASDPSKDLVVPNIEDRHIVSLETEIDNYDKILEPLKSFILPSGHVLISSAHICRTVCRRAERLVVALNDAEGCDPLVLKYLNRLSDYLFTLSRYYAHHLEIDEKEWKGLR